MFFLFRSIHLFSVRLNFYSPFSQIVTIDEVIAAFNRLLSSTVNTVA